MSDTNFDPAAAHNTQPRLRAFTITTLSRIARDGFGRCAPVPYLRMSGQWLEQYGFRVGCRVIVAAESGRLVLTLGDDPTCALAADVAPSLSVGRASDACGTPSN